MSLTEGFSHCAQEQRVEQDKALALSSQAVKSEEDKQKQSCTCCSIM